ncbi:MAG: methyltransferase domain-containing protein [Alphaproteobacteria bacterium]|nr:methyltransferase domain-containing protein [Alphaproteobacteria bacterium]
MNTIIVSSSDPIADRRISYAQMLAEAGDFAAAADLMAQALERVPDFLPGLELMGRFAEKAGLLPLAFATWRRMLACDGIDRFGAELKLAAHGALVRPAVPALGYVETLFDAYAADFDAALAQRLDYRVPQLIEDMLIALSPTDPAAGVRFARALDLGCGTGLMGERLRRQCSFLEGVDLSEAMIGAALAKRIYDRAEHGELIAWLAARSDRADLVTAADVFAYLGDLAAVFASAARVLAPGGLFLFSVEAHDGESHCVLRPSLRYAHSEPGLRSGLAAAGFDLLRLDRADLRMDRGAPIAGFVVGARRRDTRTIDELARWPEVLPGAGPKPR